jgi:hypothetical protein
VVTGELIHHNVCIYQFLILHSGNIVILNIIPKENVLTDCQPTVWLKNKRAKEIV